MALFTLDDIQKANVVPLPGGRVAYSDQEGRVRVSAIRIKEVRCGKKGCTKCPHSKYAYAQYRVGPKVKEKYIGIAR